jgi:predicted DNA-binding transcriptional regulator AlpA
MATVSFSTPDDRDNGLNAVPLRQPLLLTVEEVAALLTISVRSVWRMQSAHKIPKPVRLAGSVRWRLSEIQDWVDAGCPPLDNGKLRSSK